MLVVRAEDGDAARVSQRLPPPRLARAQRVGPVREGDPLPLPRLDLPARRLADRRPRGTQLRAIDKSALGLLPARVEEMCGLLFVNLDLSAPSLAEQVGDLPERLARYGIGSLEPVRPHRRRAAGQLEDRRRQLPRGLPRADRASRADAALRLQALRARTSATATSGSRRRFATTRPAPAPSASTAASSRPMPGLEPEDVRVWRYVFIYPNTAIDLYPDQVMTWKIDPDGVRRTLDALHRLPLRAARAAHARRAAPQREAQLARPRGGHRPREQRPGRPRDARLRSRPAVGARGRRRLVRRPRAPRPRHAAAGEVVESAAA